ncbi:lipoprotein-attachment site-containing protein [Oceanospirillum multiglobuliferum]|nr:lipoprotein [Oceanospirillum multiglobuliferum]SJZ80999.1 lipoprotein-attachment site-containing protein [Oceanospirillum multiglobuliferum]
MQRFNLLKVLLLSATVALVACGQKGPLYLPDSAPAAQQAQ